MSQVNRRKRNSKRFRNDRYRRQLRIEHLEQRLPFANVGINVSVDIQRFIPNAYTDPLNGDGDFYAIVDSFRGGNVLNTSNNPRTGPQSFPFGEVPPGPWSGVVAYSIPEEALLYGSFQQRRDLLHVSIFDYDDTSADDEIDVSPFVDSNNQRITGRATLNLDLRSGLVVGPFGPRYFNGVLFSPERESYETKQVRRSNTATGLEVVSYITLVGAGNESRYLSNSVNQIAGGETRIRLVVKYFDFDGTGQPPIDSDGDGLFDIQEGTGQFPSSNQKRADVFVTVDAMNGFAPLPLPGIVTASNTSPIVIESPHHGLSSGAFVTISGVQGNSAANGTFAVQRLSNNTFSLNQFPSGTSIGNGAYTGGGVWSVNVPNPTGTSLDLVVDAFTRAPILDKNGVRGLNLHLDVGNLNLPKENWIGDQTDLGGLKSYAAALQQRKLRPRFIDGVSRYAIFADKIVEKRDTGTSGDPNAKTDGAIGRSYGSAGFAVTMGAFETQYVDDQASVFMHFLGQSLGLDNIDGVLQDFNPNHPSVMNSLWTIPLPATFDQKNWRLDYSLGTQPDLDENSLVESVGLGGSPSGRVAIGPVRNFSSELESVASAGPVDLNANGKKTEIIARDINRFRSTDSTSLNVLKDRNEWENLQINLGSVGADFSENLTKEEFYRELTWEDVVAFESASPAKISISDATTLEPSSTGQATFIVSLDIPLHTPVSVYWSVVLGGTASASDVNTNSGTIYFLPGETSRSIIVGIKSDALMERNETFAVLLSLRTGNSVIYDNFGLGTIVDNDTEAIYTNPTGPLDVSWDGDGMLNTDLPIASNGSPKDSFLDSNGRLVVIGSNTNDTGIKIFRYLQNGLLDPTFGTGGYTTFSFPDGSGQTIANGGSVYQSGPDQDKILVAGTQSFGSRRNAFVARFNLDGTLDSTFGTRVSTFGPGQGWIAIAQTNPNLIAYIEGFDVAIYESGPFAGQFVLASNINFGTAGVITQISRHNANGSLDQSFRQDGDGTGLFDPDADGTVQFVLNYTTAPVGLVPTAVTKILIDGNGKLLLAGGASGPDVARTISSVLIRLNADGGLDTSFGDGRLPGASFVNPDPGGGNGLGDIAIQPDGGIIGVQRGDGYYASGRLVRFSSQGVVTYTSPQVLSLALSVASDAAGRAYLGGTTDTGLFSLARFVPVNSSNTTFSLDLNFDPVERDGIVNAAPGGFGGISSMRVTSDGSVLASGRGTNSSSIGFATNKYESERNDLSLSMTADSLSLLTNGRIVYTIRVRNTGDDAVFASIRDILPAGTAFASLNVPTGWIYEVNNDVLIAARRSLKQSDGEQTLTLVLTNSGIGGTTVTNTVTASSATVDYNLANNTVQLITAVSPDLALDVRSTRIDSVGPDEQVSFLYCVKNNGQVATPFVVTTSIPAGTSFVSASDNGQLNGNTISWQSQGSLLAPGELRTVRLTVVTSGTGNVRSTATVNSPVADLTPSDNTQSSRIMINAAPVSVWEAGNDATDATGTNPGSLVNGVGFAQGRFGSAFNFNNSNYVSIPDSPSLDLTGTMTISTWVYLTANNFNDGIVFKGPLNGNQGVYSLGFYTGGSNRPVFRVNGGAGSVTGNTNLSLNRWYHIAATYDNTSLKLYVDGNLDSTSSYSGQISTNNDPLIIGGYFSTGYLFEGRVDDVSLFNEALTATDIAQIAKFPVYNRRPTISAVNPMVSVPAGTLATNFGSFNDPDGDNLCVFLSASIGTVTRDPQNPGRWNWSVDTTNLPISTDTVNVTVNDGFGGISSTTFTLNSSTPTIVSISVNPSEVLEDGTQNLVFTVSRTGPNLNALPITYFVIPVAGTVFDLSDYVLSSPDGFANGQTSYQIIFDPIADTQIELDEIYVIGLRPSDNNAYILGTSSSAQGTILNDDIAPTITVTVDPSTATESGNDLLLFTFTRTGLTALPLSVNFAISGLATLGADYALLDTRGAFLTALTATFDAGSATAVILVNPSRDTQIEDNEDVSLSISASIASVPQYLVGVPSSASGTIIDDTPTIAVAVRAPSINEGSAGRLEFVFTRTGRLDEDLTVYYSAAGAATFGSDYQAFTPDGQTADWGNSIYFISGASTYSVFVDPTDDGVIEADETIQVTLAASPSNPQRYRIGTSNSATATILNDDFPAFAVSLLSGPSGNNIALRRNLLDTSKLELVDIDSTLILANVPLGSPRLTINGRHDEAESLLIDYSYGGFFALPEGVYFNGGSGSGDALIVIGTGGTTFNFVSSGGSIGNAAIEAFDWIERDTIRFTGVEPLSILNAIDINVSGPLNVGNQILTLDSAGFTTLGQTTTLTGGTINAAGGLVLATGQTILGRGAINAPIYSAPGSTITLNGNLILGDVNAFDGIDLHGRLNVGAFTVTLNDGYKAVLGSQTTIGSSTVDGILNAPNGIALEDNQTLVGRGVINTTNGTFENQGHVQGQSAAAKIKFSQLVTGRGSFANVEFNGGSSLGNSPTLTDMQGATSFGTTNVHTVEIGGLIAGSEFDKIQSTGTVILIGALDVKLIALNNGYTPTLGQSFTIVSAAQVTGTFSSAFFPPSILGGSWKINYSPTAVTVQLSGSAPIDLTASNLLIPENLQPSLFLSALSAIDPDTIEQHTYSLVSGDGSTDNGVFEIVGNQLRPKQVFDFETKSIYSIRIKVVDAAGLAYEKSLSIGVVDMTEVAAVTIGDGSAQRSLLKQLKVTFDGLVDITNLNSGTFTVRKRDSGMAIIANNAIISTVGAGASAQTVVTLSFTGSFVESNGSLANGNYDLIIDANNIVRTGLEANTRLDGNRDGTAGGNFRFGSNAQNQAALTDAFFRLLGDFSGSGSVDNADLGIINDSFRSKVGQPLYKPELDLFANGGIDNRDLGIFNPLFRSKRTEA